MKWVAYLFILLIVILTAQAATIQGSVYDFYLNKADNCKVTISTEPIQQIVLTDAAYSFEVQPGEYDLIAYQLENGKIISAAKETLAVSKDGTYQIDLILFPYFESEDILKESENLFQEQQDISNKMRVIWLLFIGGLIVIAGLIFLAYLKIKKLKQTFMPKDKPKLDSELQKMLDFIKKHKRTTQKEIRKEFFLSEGKISLMISELEEKQLIKKIKKGRGNIVVLK